MPEYRIAIIGIGAIGEMHARAIADIDNAKLVAGVCRGEEKGRKFASDFDCGWFSDVDAMLAESKPDVVTICTPSGAHLSGALPAIASGVHVLVEKPIEITTARADEMIAAAEKAGVVLGGIFPQRFNPVVQAIQKAAVDGRFGQLSTANAYVPWWRDDAYYAPERWQGTLSLDGGGALINQSIHAIDAVTWIAGTAIGSGASNPVEQVFGFTGKRGHAEELIEVEDTAVAALRYRNGAMGVILGCTSMWPGSFQRMHVGGRDGTAEVHEESLVTWQFRNETAADEAIRNQFVGAKSSGGGASDPMAIDYANHTRNIADFLEAIEQGRSPLIDGHEARKSLAIIEAIYTSGKTGLPVNL